MHGVIFTGAAGLNARGDSKGRSGGASEGLSLLVSSCDRCRAVEDVSLQISGGGDGALLQRRAAEEEVLDRRKRRVKLLTSGAHGGDGLAGQWWRRAVA